MLKLTSYNFIRNEQADFRDDGNKFKAYFLEGYPTIRVTVCTYQGTYYIAAHEQRYLLYYPEYSQLPGYNELDLLNTGCTEEYAIAHIQELIQAIKTFSKAYNEAVSNIRDITDEEYMNWNYIHNIKPRKDFLDSLEFDINKLFNLADYELTSLKRYYNALKNELNENLPSQVTRRKNIQDNKTWNADTDFYAKTIKELLK